VEGRAPEVPPVAAPAELATMIDMAHFLSDGDADQTLRCVRERMRPGGWLLVRASLVPHRPRPWSWWVQNLVLRLTGVPVVYRSTARLAELVTGAGFRLERTLPSGPHGELVWLVARNAGGRG
jgi:hypothetical protein